MHVQRCFFFFAYETYRFFTLIYFLVARQPILSRYYRNSPFIYNDDNQILLFYPRQEYKQSCNNKSDLRFPDISEGERGAKKIIFTACHSGKLKLASTSPDVISTSPKSL